MYPFPQAVTPAIQTHVDAQTAFFNDLSKCMFRSFQQMCNLNIQLVQTLLEESATAGQQMMTADRQTEMMSAAASRAQPITDKLRAYHQHVSRLAADVQVDMARVAEQHVQNTSRTARSLADEVARTASEETERGLRAQQETVRRFADPFARNADGSASQAQMWTGQTSSTMQSGGQGAAQGSTTQGKPASNAKGGAQQTH